MSEQKWEGRELTGDEMEAEYALELPDREAMSVTFWTPGTPLVHPHPHDVVPIPPDPEVGPGDPVTP